MLNIGEFILNMPVIGKQQEAELAALNLEVSGTAMASFVIFPFIAGIIMMWIYAAVRPRLGAGPKTAIMVGLAAWFFFYVWGVSSYFVLGILSAKIFFIAAIWGLFEFPIAAVIGAWIYKEEEESESSPA